MKLRISMTLIALSLTSMALAQPAPRAAAQRRPAIVAEYLQLTPDQVAAWKQINQETTAAIKPLLEQVRAARKAANQKRLAVLTPEQKARLDAMRAAAVFMRRPR